MVKPRFGARGGARHVAVMGHELVCIIYAAGPTQPVGVGLVSEWHAGDRGMVVLLVRRRRPVGLYLHSERREGDAVSPWSTGSGGASRWLMEHSRRSGGATASDETQG